MVIPFEEEYRKNSMHWKKEIFNSNFWSEGDILKRFEDAFGEYVKAWGKSSVKWGSGLLAIEYV